MISILFYLIVIIAFLLITFFGLGPVLFADGVIYERILTFVVVIVLYLALVGIVLFFINRKKHQKKS